MMSNWMISVVDLDKPVMREDMLVDKRLVEGMIDRSGNLGLIVEQLMLNIEGKRRNMK